MIFVTETYPGTFSFEMKYRAFVIELHDHSKECRRCVVIKEENSTLLYYIEKYDRTITRMGSNKECVRIWFECICGKDFQCSQLSVGHRKGKREPVME